jgi:putative transposase
MELAGIQEIHPGPNTSKRNKLHAIHPYFLNGMDITNSNQAWMVDITYLRMLNRFMYLVVLIDVYSRYVVVWASSNMLDTQSCIDSLKSGLAYTKPEIINRDQGCQFTSEEWISFLREWKKLA